MDTKRPRTVKEQAYDNRKRAAKRSDGISRRAIMLQFIIQWKREHDGNSPSVKDIMNGCSISSTSVVTHHLARLERDGKLFMKFHEPRTIQVIGGVWMLKTDLEDKLEFERETIRVLRQPA